MATQTSVILSRATTLLQDPTFVRWPLLELFGYLSDGQKEVCIHKPNAYVKTSAVQLVAGTKQALPADGLVLIDVVRNMGANGSTVGNAVRNVAREILDSNSPGWHQVTASGVVKHYTYDAKAPKVYYVYPPQPNSSMHYVELIYGAVPADLVVPTPSAQISDFAGTMITLDDIYAGALVDYVVFRAHSKEAEYAIGGVADKYLQQFLARLTGKTTGEVMTDPTQPGVK